MGELKFTQIEGIPLIQAGDNIAEILLYSIKNQEILIEDGDILAVTSKIISKAEDRLVYLNEVQPSEKALELGKIINRDPRLMELVLSESKEIVRATEQAIIVEHKLGFICANAGIDHSNVQGKYGKKEDWYLLLPQVPDQSAERIRDYFKEKTDKDIGVIVIDSHGRPWRKGTVGVIIGTSQVPALVDLRGKSDLFGYHLKISEVAAGDELAGAASMMMGQADEKIPAIHVKGFPYQLRNSSIAEVLRSKNLDLFR
ncbi:MAG: coenzyme F420-0:L-glutamate ligase [Pelolinea sp.]|nr:coenzyme F420-0:L-glutamate ligase [Pelolinea sp.]